MSHSVWPHDQSPPGSPVHGILQARILEWAAVSPPKGLLEPEIKPKSLKSTCIGRRVLDHWRHLGSPALSPALLNYLLLIAWTHHRPHAQQCSLCAWMMPLLLHHHLDTMFPPLRAGPSAEDTLLVLINDRTIFSILALAATGLFHRCSV